MNINDKSLIRHLINNEKELYSLSFVSKSSSHNSSDNIRYNPFDSWIEYEEELINPSKKAEEINIMLEKWCVDIYKVLVKQFCKKFNLQAPIKHKKIVITKLHILEKPEEFIESLKIEQNFALEKNPYKRDNIIHQFRVFLLGYYLISSNEQIQKWLYEDIENLLTMGSSNYCAPNGKIIFHIWALTSLFHDMGRGIETCYKTLDELKKTFEPIFKKFDIDLPIQDTEFHPKNAWNKKKETFLKLFDRFYKRNMDKNLYKKLEDAFKKSLSKPKHGMISALLIILPEIENILQDWEETYLKLKNAYDNSGEDFRITKKIIASMSGNKQKNLKYFLTIYPKIILLFYAAVAIALHDIDVKGTINPQ